MYNRQTLYVDTLSMYVSIVYSKSSAHPACPRHTTLTSLARLLNYTKLHWLLATC